MEVHQVKAKQGLQWIMSGFYLFRMTPAAWILLTFTLILILMSLALVPLLGQFVFTLIFPVFLAGLMLGCQALERGQKLDLSYLFIAFKTNSAPLITIGGVYLIGQVLIVGIVMLIGGTVMVDMLLYGKRVDESELMGVMDNILTASLVAIVLSIPLLMAAWFSPLLVVFHNVPPVIAMQRSFFACLRNFIPFQLYGITLIILAIIALMPYGLGLIILVPTVFGSIYVSYKDIFLGETFSTNEEKAPEDYQKATWSDTAYEESTEDDVKIKESDTNKNESTVKKEHTVKKVNDLVECAQCSVNLPKGEAILNMGKYFCSEEHREQYQSKEAAEK